MAVKKITVDESRRRITAPPVVTFLGRYTATEGRLFVQCGCKLTRIPGGRALAVRRLQRGVVDVV